ncbi:alpha-amylase family glycosyl hydrolase [Luteolibacter sp. LG18]|uniref:alpha-amylase family glycosyl hydrolase n=1 Tax=Luteolibacter sp. LG18 TaxID=2819286 RepID=UPI002B282062|nr:alpha-amylase [Luteolibacter sp. LG18]
MSRRPVIYQLFVRLFGNTRPTVPGGTLDQNGCGKFNDIDDAALANLAATGFTHVWLTGVLEQASGTSYPDRPADDPAILKGIAGSPYAIRDYFDVCPDYAVDPTKRLDEFKTLLARCARHGLKPVIDFVPNHVARTYASDVRPELTFGAGDDTSVFFATDNHFFYLRPTDPGGGPPLRLPVADGLFEPERFVGKVTGNNLISWAPSINDWYETVKLNYGHDFTTGRNTSHLPGIDAPIDQVPKTWRTMDAILSHWQEFGVSGFRTDMSHMIPLEFWRWAVKRCRERDPDVFFFGEAYDSDPMKLTDSDVLQGLLDAGFDAIYDHPPYKVLKGIYDGSNWANDLNPLPFETHFHHSVRYAENHDEVRLASFLHWGGLGLPVGKPVSAILLGMSRGPIMMYNGQEVGEQATERMGFGGGDGRTSIFDYGSMPEVVKMRQGGLAPSQIDLRQWYADLLGLVGEPAFTAGDFYGLNFANGDNPNFGRVGNESYSGHWLFAFLRHDAASGQAFLVITNLNGRETLRNVHVRIPYDALHGLGRDQDASIHFSERLSHPLEIDAFTQSLPGLGLPVGDLAPFEVRILAF